ncbi:unnamed protein product [Trifolium pratense]|uniref:Uncharacterized protein n=1 Tax=Trifolium pratense TaxID=57577 RepID=A0ACB0IEJ0_TRIPR|nr:unnamed protein product [Trifolium pratense]
MEPAQLIFEEWDSLSGQYTAEEADFMTQFLCDNTNTNFDMPSSYFPSNVSNANFMCFSQGSSTSTDKTANIFSTNTCDLATSIDSLSMFFSLEDAKFSPQYLDDSLSKQVNYECIDKGSVLELVHAKNNLQAKMEHDHEMMMVSEPPSEEDSSQNIENSAKRFRSSIEVSENMRNVRKCPKSAYMNNNENGIQWHGFSNCFSKVDSNAYVELNGRTSPSLSPKEPEAPNLCKKSRATNGPATDAQSIYARRRRERINERLRILQTLVPNGTKVDISTMLEEAVQYVKFLQLQIKVLSSEDMWMYAPIAYNGINIGLDLSFN